MSTNYWRHDIAANHVEYVYLFCITYITSIN